MRNATKEEMIKEEAINIAEEFSEWLEDMTEKYRLDKDEVQDLIRRFLMCGSGIK